MVRPLVRRRVGHALKAAAVIVAGCLFIYQVSLEVQRYLCHFTATSVSLEMPPTLDFPQVVLCPDLPFNPVALRDLGMDISAPPGASSEERLQSILENIIQMKGVDRATAAAEVWGRASFELGELVERFSFGDVSENYTEQTQGSQYWKKLLTPFGSCLALDLPHIKNKEVVLPKVSIQVKMKPSVPHCPRSSISCPAADEDIMRDCNSTCALEEFLQLKQRLTYYVFVSRQYPGEAPGEPLEPSGSHARLDPFASGVWQVAKLGEDGQPLNVLTIDSLLVKVRPINCRSSRFKGPGFSFGKCFIKRMQEKHRCVPVYANSNVTITDACKVSVLHHAIVDTDDEEDFCNVHTMHGCSYTQWTHEVKSGLSMIKLSSYQLELAFASPKIRVETEIDLYPFPQLASDIGGSLGLCLGMSLLTVWRWILVPREEHPYSTSHHFRHLLYWSVVTLLTFSTALHGLVSLQEYFNQPPLIAVTPAGSTKTTGGSDRDILHDQAAARLASRALDCRQDHLSEWEECVLDCLMKLALQQVGHVAPFIDVKDLPPCQEREYWEPRSTYVVPSLPMTTVMDQLLVRSCRRRCSHLGALNASDMETPMGMLIDHEYYRITACDLLCSLGGIVSLYAGLFLSSLIPAIVSFLPDTTRRTRLFRRFLTMALESTIYVSGAALSVLLVYRYIFAHPISSSSSGQPLRTAEQPAVTACHFPPFLEPLREDSALPIDEQWANAAWPERISRVAITQEVGRMAAGKHGYNVTPVLTPLNRCYTVTAALPYNNFVASLYYWWDDNDLVVFSIHNQNDPPFASKVFHLRSYSAVTLTVTPFHYTRLSQDDHPEESYDLCLDRCVQDSYSDAVGCRLPYVSWRPDLPLCDPASARRHPAWPRQPLERPPAEDTDSRCHKACRSRLREFYLTTTQTQTWIEPGINIIQKRGNYHDFREEDWYELSQLGNDLGVVAGFTLGTSILSLLQAAIQRLIP